MPISDAKRRQMKRKILLHTRMELEIAREKGHGVNFTSYMEVSEYEPQLIEEELKQACLELNVLNNMIEQDDPKEMLEAQIHVMHSLIRPRGFLEQQMSNHNAKSIEGLKGIL